MTTPEAHSAGRYQWLASIAVHAAALGALLHQDQVHAALVSAACLSATPVARRVPLPWALLTPVALLGVVAAGWLTGGPAALGWLLAYLLVHRQWARRTRIDDQLSALLACLALITAISRSTELTLLPLWLLWALFTPALLLDRHTPAKISTLAGLGALALAAPLFLLFPRVGDADTRTHDASHLTGFSPEVDLGSMDVLLDDPTLVFRATMQPQPTGPVVWRGLALDQFDGSRWWSSTEPSPAVLQAPSTFGPNTVSASVLLEPTAEGVLFTTGEVMLLEVGGGLLADGQGGWFAEDRNRRVAYELIALSGPREQPTDRQTPTDPARWLALPEDIDPDILALTDEVVGDEVDGAAINAIVRHLRTTTTYTRRPADDGAEAPLSTFLFERKTGHCEYYATAVAVMARAAGLPSRVVNGFVSDEINPATGRLLVRRQHAHSWAEVFVEGRGWLPVDATPGPSAPPPQATVRERLSDAVATAWQEGVVGYERSDQAPYWLAALLALAATAALATLLASKRGRLVLPLGKPKTALDAYKRGRARAARLGCIAPEHLAPVAAATHLIDAHGDRLDPLLELAWLAYDEQLAGHPPDTEAVAHLWSQLRTRLAADPSNR